jgi:hypothetical protein
MPCPKELCGPMEGQAGLQATQTLLRVKGSSLFNEPAALKAWLDVRKPDAEKSTRLNRVTELPDHWLVCAPARL